MATRINIDDGKIGSALARGLERVELPQARV